MSNKVLVLKNRKNNKNIENKYGSYMWHKTKNWHRKHKHTCTLVTKVVPIKYEVRLSF